ncbi:MAG: hypothetical protein GY866_38235 [Proteobacteria bacterium]|nr:hypothetical protein [Pseudomonadota bacterium]
MSGVPGGDFSETAANVPHSDLLKRFTQAVMGDDDRELDQARSELVSELGNEALVDVAAVIAQFESVNRVADATGIRLDDMLEEALAAGLAKPDLPENIK